MTDRVTELILSVVRDLNQGLPAPVPVDRGRETPLFGGDGVLDSLGLVQLVLAVEEAVEDRFGVSVSLADERAISQSASPFRTLGSLARYTADLLGEVSQA